MRGRMMLTAAFAKRSYPIALFFVAAALMAFVFDETPSFAAADPADVGDIGTWGRGAADPANPRPVLNRQYLPAVLDMIASAKTTIHIIQYEYVAKGTVRDIEQAILAAARRGVSVKMLVDDTVKSSRGNVEWLAKKGIDVKLDETAPYGAPGDKKTHAKMILVDGEKLIVGSTNFSAKSIDDNNESNIYLASAVAGRAMRSYFDQLWETAAREPRMGPRERRLPDADIWFNRQYFPNARQLFRNARSRIYVVLYGMNIGPPGSKVRELIAELKRAKDGGVDVRVMLDRSDGQFADKTMEINEEAKSFLEKLKIPVKFDSPDVITHAKILIVDDTAVVGGTNWGSGPMDQYNDCNVALWRPDAVQKLAEAFLSIWNGRSRF